MSVLLCTNWGPKRHCLPRWVWKNLSGLHRVLTSTPHLGWRGTRTECQASCLASVPVSTNAVVTWIPLMLANESCIICIPTAMSRTLSAYVDQMGCVDPGVSFILPADFSSFLLFIKSIHVYLFFLIDRVLLPSVRTHTLHILDLWLPLGHVDLKDGHWIQYYWPAQYSVTTYAHMFISF